MLRHHAIPIAALFVLAGLFGCHPAAPEEMPSIMPPQATIELHHPEALALIRTHGFGPEVKVLMEAHSAFSSEVLRILHTSRSWSAAHRSLQTLLEREPAPEWAITSPALREQIVAAYMLQVETLRRSHTPEALDATETYVRMLIEHGSPEAYLIVDGLRKLTGHVSAEDHRRLTEVALANARERLGEKLSCERCGLEQLRARRPELFTGASALPEARLASAIYQLEAMLPKL